MKINNLEASLGIAAVLAVAALTGAPAAAQAAKSKGPASEVYVAHLHAMNSKVTGLRTTGEARFAVRGDVLTITVNLRSVPPGIVHWQHLHGFKDGRDANCPTGAADANQDGVIDVAETEPVSGTTMVPFDKDPAGMQIAHGTYPKASAGGTYRYREVVSMKALDKAFGKTFTGEPLDLSERVVMIHGVPASTHLPASVASLGTIPADITLPIACGKIERVAR